MKSFLQNPNLLSKNFLVRVGIFACLPILIYQQLSTVAFAAATCDQTEIYKSGIHFFDCTTSCNSASNTDATAGNASSNTIVLDPGHAPGPYSVVTDPNTGIETEETGGAPNEMQTMWDVATQIIQPKLEKDGYKVVLTKNSVNDKADFITKIKRADDANAALVVSLHYTGGVPFGTPNDHFGVTPQEVGRFRQNTDNGKRYTFTDATLAQKSQAAAQAIAQARIAAGDNVKVSPLDQSFPQSRGLPAWGDISIVQLLSKTPWVYNEDGAVGFDKQKYGNGIADGIEKAVPANGSSTSGGGCCPTSSGGSGSATSSGPSGTFSLDQVKTFASEPYSSTWNISNSTVEQWFLKQAGAQPVISRYGLNSSNIGQITSAVQAAGVSPAFFYLYTVNEGGGAGGFINHYGSSTGSGTADATRDAQYLVSQSKDKSAGPATGGGEPSDMPTAEAKQILDALPSGSIGVVYIQATAAVTAELEYLSGKTGDWNPQDSASPATQFGSPLEEEMKNIKTMGGDPLQGGSTISTGSCTSSGVAGAGMQKGINFAIFIAKDDGYGYDQPTRETGWQKYQSGPGCTSKCGSFDCSSFISAIVTVAGYYQTNPNFATSTEAAVLGQAGFRKVANSAHSSASLHPGDILLAANHTELYIGNDQNVGAHINELNGVSGGQVGDQSGNEISVTPFYDDNWIGVFRAPN